MRNNILLTFSDQNNLSDIDANIIKNSGWASAFEKDSIFLNNRKNSE